MQSGVYQVSAAEGVAGGFTIGVILEGAKRSDLQVHYT